jgi:hypothetical protein
LDLSNKEKADKSYEKEINSDFEYPVKYEQGL